MNRKIYTGVCHGTLGELFQGSYVIRDKIHIAIISLPIRKYSQIHFFSNLEGNISIELKEKIKCRRAVDFYLRYYNLKLPKGRWELRSELAEGKGMASSTADILATVRCLDSIFGHVSEFKFTNELLYNIERSDSVFEDIYCLYLSDKQKNNRKVSF